MPRSLAQRRVFAEPNLAVPSISIHYQGKNAVHEIGYRVLGTHYQTGILCGGINFIRLPAENSSNAMADNAIDAVFRAN